MNFLPETPPLETFIEQGITKFLFIDFDGVINMVDYYHHPTHPFSKDEIFRCDTYGYGYDDDRKFKLDWSSELIERLNALTARPDVQVIWLTTWRKYMGEVCKTLGLTAHNQMYYLPWDKKLLTDGKVDAFVEYLNPEPSTPVTISWVDDLVFLDDNAVKLAKELSVNGTEIYTHRPRSRVAIDRAMMGEIEEELS